MDLTAFSLSLSLYLALTSASAGPKAEASAAGRPNMAAMNQRFEQARPRAGEVLPNVAAYEADGTPFRLHSLKGRYTVLVFGCLT